MTRPYIFTPKFNLSLRLTSSCIDKSACGIQTARHCTSVSESFSEIMKLSAPSRPRPPGYYYSRASTVLYGVMLRVCLSVVSVLNWLHVQIVSLRSELIWFGLLDVYSIIYAIPGRVLLLYQLPRTADFPVLSILHAEHTDAVDL